MTKKESTELTGRASLAQFGPGPWQDEPDRVEWRFEGFACLMVRQPDQGHWCGYVGLPPGHPWHGKDPDDAQVHGGITYGSPCEGVVCHVPQPGEPDEVWWLGFDCAHSGDLSPGSMQRYGWPPMSGTYKDRAYVEREVEQLARQAAEAKP